MKIRVHGDSHGKYSEFLPKLLFNDLNIHVGDLGYNYTDVDKYVYENRINFRHIPGNHENYDELINNPRNWTIGSYGNIGGHMTGIPDIFYCRGAFSIDWLLREKKRISGEWPRTWWPEEELSYKNLNDAIAKYIQMAPEVVITHEAPRSIVNKITDGRVLRNWGYDPETFTTRTSEALDQMFQAHQPKRWLLGHYHRDMDFIVGKTQFSCIGELCYRDIKIE